MQNESEHCDRTEMAIVFNICNIGRTAGVKTTQMNVNAGIEMEALIRFDNFDQISNRLDLIAPC